MSYQTVDETAAGLKLGRNSSDKIGFYGTAPATQPANSVTARAALETLGLVATGGTDTTFYKSADQTLTDGVDIAVGSTAGTKIATATTQKLGFFNATPVVQPASADQAAAGTATTVGDNTGTAGAGLSLIGDTTSVDQAAAIMNDFKALQEDIAGLTTLVNALRSALVDLGIVKGAA